MKVRNHETLRFNIKKIYIDDDPDYKGFKVSFVINDKYMEYDCRGRYIDDVFTEIMAYLYLKANEEEDKYIKI